MVLREMEFKEEIQVMGFVSSCGCGRLSPQVPLIEICPKSSLGQNRGLKVGVDLSPQILFPFPLPAPPEPRDGIANISSAEKRKPDLPTSFQEGIAINAGQKIGSLCNRT